MHGLKLVNHTFETAKSEGRALFMPYFPVGFPDLQTSLGIMESFARVGADAIEIGVPFSDPLADGPTIQAATQVALQNGVTLFDCLNAVALLRGRGVKIPLMLMSYVNPLMAYGLDKLVKDGTEVGVSGFIVPDLPADEAAHFQALTDKHSAAFVHFLAPTSSPERIELAAKMGRGFLYLVSVAGVTGARNDVPPDLKEFIGRVRQVASLPLAVGFGIGSPEKAKAVGEIADGVIIGSKLIKLAEEDPAEAVEFALKIRAALDT